MNVLSLSWKTNSHKPSIIVASGSAQYRSETAALFRPLYAIKMAKNLGQVLALGADRKPEILVLDETFPEQDGIPSLIRIRLHPAFRTVPTVFTTENDVSVDLHREIANDRTAILRKPVHRSRFLEAVSQFIDIGIEADRQRAI